MNNPITITENAATKIADIIAEENNPATKLRIFVQGGGCSGFSYGFTLDDVIAEDDTIVTEAGISILIDAMSFQYLMGAEIDYKETLMNSSFTINNPNSVSTCGCGQSFST